METKKTAGNLSYRLTFSKITNSYIEYAYLLNSFICGHSRIKHSVLFYSGGTACWPGSVVTPLVTCNSFITS